MLKMKLILFFLVVVFLNLEAQNSVNYNVGEKLEFKINYSIFNAATASVTLNEENIKGVPHFRAVGVGESSGALSFFCKVNDKYETFINKATNKPTKFIRKVSECSHTIDVIQNFNFNTNEVEVIDNKNKTNKKFKINNSTQDLISAFYYLRNLNTNIYKEGDLISLDIFLDEQIFPFRFKILKREIIRTKFGKINAIKIRPYVQNGRIFKEQESVTAWISDDLNRVPLKIQAELSVGSIKISLNDHENLKYPFNKK